MNDDDSPSILQRQTAPTTQLAISHNAIDCHGLINSPFERYGLVSVEMRLCCQHIRKIKREQRYVIVTLDLCPFCQTEIM